MRGSEQPSMRPRPVDFAKQSLRDREPAAIAMGPFHTSIVSFTGRTFVCGLNHENQLMESDGEHVRNLAPVKGLMDKVVKSVDNGASHSVVVTANGIAMSFGNNEFGQLGHVGGRKTLVAPISSSSAHYRLSHL